jgi:NRPS condensation-like uncharacterized protein
MIVVAPASFAQARVWHDEQIHFQHQAAMAFYNKPFLYRLSSQNTLSIQQLRHALQLLLTKHQSLRTSLISDPEKNQLIQKIIELNHNSNESFTFIESTFETDEQLNNIMHDEKHNPQLFAVAQGLVFRCHIVYYKQVSSYNLFTDKDVLIFNFHHAIFDRPSMDVFLHDLNQAYTIGLLTNDDDNLLRYLDCKHKYVLLITIYLSFLSLRFSH